MKEDLDIAKNSLVLLNEENTKLKRQLGSGGKSIDKVDEVGFYQVFGMIKIVCHLMPEWSQSSVKV